MKNEYTKSLTDISDIKEYITHIVIIALIGILIGGFVIYKVFPHKVTHESLLYERVVINFGFADFFHSIFPIPIENKVKFKKLKWDDHRDKILYTTNFPYLSGRSREYDETDEYWNTVEIVDLDEAMMTDEEIYIENIKSNGLFEQIDEDDE